jgi:crotonobetainyl-CoA:carnitine CoA-transferase CaiB-like acyl-CoA transferase
MNLLRNKRNVALDAKHPAGRDAVLRLAATCDVFLTNLRPGPLRRLGLDYADVAAVRPDIVYCQAQGYPSDSDRADDPAYDDVIQAGSGIADAMAQIGQGPALAPTLLADKVAGLVVTYAVIAALFHRERTGEGQRVEVPMTEAVRAFMLVEHGAAAIPDPPVGPAGYQRILSPFRRPVRSLDGWISVFPYADSQWEAVLRHTGHDDLVGDERLTRARRFIDPGPAYELLATIVATRTNAEWVAFCDENRIPVAEVATLDDLVNALPTAEHPLAGRYRVIPPPARFSRTPASVRRPAPVVGEHNREALLEAGLTDEEVSELERLGVLRADPSGPRPPD